MNAFDDCIGLRAPSRYRFPFFLAIVIVTHLGKSSHKFGTTIKHNSLWKFVTSEPSFLGDIYNFAAVSLGICAISNQLVVGLIIVKHHNFSGFSLFKGLHMDQ